MHILHAYMHNNILTYPTYIHTYMHACMHIYKLTYIHIYGVCVFVLEQCHIHINHSPQKIKDMTNLFHIASSFIFESIYEATKNGLMPTFLTNKRWEAKRREENYKNT